MSKLREVEKELKARQDVFTKLHWEKDVILASINEMQGQRDGMVRLLVSDESQRRPIMKIEKQIQLRELDAESLSHKIAEAEAKVAAAAEDLKKAQAEHDLELAEFISQREQEDLMKLKASLPAREQRVMDLYAAFLEELGNFAIDAATYGNGRPLQEIGDFTQNLPRNMHETLRGKGLRPLMIQGLGGQLAAWAHVALPEDIAGQMPGRGPVNHVHVAEAVRAKRMAAYCAEFERANE